MAEKLKPCPFCGGKAVFIQEFGYVVCLKCGCRTATYLSAVFNNQQVITKWNRRVNDA